MLNTYKEKFHHYTDATKALRRLNSSISLGRLISILLLIYLAYKYYQQASTIIIGIIVLLVVVIGVLIYSHTKKKLALKYSQALADVNKTEIEFLENDMLQHNNGLQFIDPSHDYSYDIDLFGNRSLFHLINRTESFPGRLQLANAFLHPKATNEILNTQEAIIELSKELDWRQEFAAKLKMQADSEQQYHQLIAWSKKEPNFLPPFILFLAYALPLLLIGSYGYYLISAKVIFESISGYLFLINLGVFATQLGRIKKEMPTTEKIYPVINQYGQLFQHIEKKMFTSSTLNSMQSSLSVDGSKISELIHTFSNLLNRMDSIQNGLGAMIFNGIGLYHLHTLNTLNHWKRKYGNQIEKWLEILGAFEAMNALANFAYNHPKYVFPRLHQENQIEFKQLGHPLLHESKRVCSDVSFDQKKFIIITGSNMSGKSTFLRSLGVNMILAEMGAPVCASDAALKPLTVVASMRTDDSLKDSESYFFAEVKRLKHIIAKLHHEPCFILLDEILKGTNSDDKRTGTIAFIKKIIAYQAIGVIATHDLEVCHTTEEYPNYLMNQCFEVEIINDELLFDYKLREGVCKNKSAYFLMKKMDII